MNNKTIITALGVILFLIAGFKMSVLGYYPSDLAWIIPLYVVGLVGILVGRKMPANKR
ncbi:hypothetical protein [Arthrobacter sp. SRS-W-1-2016]|uniref:hypothetical protein n=1 Tax=Arthrobacter sp. SRS-W-1-2016 TaxID=1930254 RepID=UPI0015C54015|nr:hypothetical protein [Arthrobacter sp. SRS-W-1-2016]